MWYFEYFGYHYSTQKLSCQKLWHLSFQTPYRTCFHEAWMCFCILIKIEDFCLISNEKVIFLQIQWNIKKSWILTSMWLLIQDDYTHGWHVAGKLRIYNFRKTFFWYHLGYHVWMWSHICTLCWYIFIQKLKWIRWI